MFLSFLLLLPVAPFALDVPLVRARLIKQDHSHHRVHERAAQVPPRPIGRHALCLTPLRRSGRDGVHGVWQ